MPGWEDGFHFGVACAGFQCEGDNPDSNWKRYTDREAPKGTVDPVKSAAGFRQRYKEDIQRASNLGVNTFRFSIEWARVETERGPFSEEAFA